MDVSLQSGDAPPEEAPLPDPPAPPASGPSDTAALHDGLAGMDVSAQTLRDVKFREKFRGYHPDDVDEFLEQVAEGITYLQGRLREAQDGAGDAQAPGVPAANNEALRRTLVLAQRTAELAVQEARHEAERIQSQARQHAESIVSRAEEAARRTVEETNARLRDEVGKLEASRQRLRADVDELERYLEEQRQQLHASLSDALTKVENVLPPASRPAPEPEAPEVPPVPWPEPVERSALWEPPVHDDNDSPLVVDEPGDPEPVEPLTVADHDIDRHIDRDIDDDEDDEEVGSIWASGSSDPADGPLGARSVPAPLDDEDDDPFIAELRRAITDTSPLGPRDDFPLPPPVGIEQPQEQEVPGGRRFRRKRR